MNKGKRTIRPRFEIIVNLLRNNWLIALTHSRNEELSKNAKAVGVPTKIPDGRLEDLASCDQPQRCSEVSAHDVQPQSRFDDDAPKMPMRFTMVDIDSEVER